MTGTEKLLTPAEVAGMLRVSVRTLRRLHDRRRIPAAIPVGSSLRWRAADVEKWIARGGK